MQSLLKVDQVLSQVAILSDPISSCIANGQIYFLIMKRTNSLLNFCSFIFFPSFILLFLSLKPDSYKIAIHRACNMYCIHPFWSSSLTGHHHTWFYFTKKVKKKKKYISLMTNNKIFYNAAGGGQFLSFWQWMDPWMNFVAAIF